MIKSFIIRQTRRGKGQVCARLVLALAVTATSASSYAQDGEAMEWAGTLAREGHPVREVVFNVREDEEGPQFESLIYADEPFQISAQRLDGEVLYFRWTPGKKDAVCQLITLSDGDNAGDYRGDCEIEGSARIITLQISPPAEYLNRGGKKKQQKAKAKEKQSSREGQAEPE